MKLVLERPWILTVT